MIYLSIRAHRSAPAAAQLSLQEMKIPARDCPRAAISRRGEGGGETTVTGSPKERGERGRGGGWGRNYHYCVSNTEKVGGRERFYCHCVSHTEGERVGERGRGWGREGERERACSVRDTWAIITHGYVLLHNHCTL